jgi:hypothetical protein
MIIRERIAVLVPAIAFKSSLSSFRKRQFLLKPRDQILGKHNFFILAIFEIYVIKFLEIWSLVFVARSPEPLRKIDL